MDRKRSAWLLILTAVIVMTVACFAPAMLMNGQVFPGWFTAAFSGIGTCMGIAEGNGKLAALCGLGLVANVMFLVALLASSVRRLFHWKRPAYRTLSFCVIFGLVSGVGSIFWLYPSATEIGAWLWLVAQAVLALGLSVLPQPKGQRGFEVLSVHKAEPLLQISAANPSKT